MHARRWSLFGAFAAGCLSSAVFIAWHWGESGAAHSSEGNESEHTPAARVVPHGQNRNPVESGDGLERRNTLEPRESLEHRDDTASVAVPSDVEKGVSSGRADAEGAQGSREGEKSVADVLADLEAQYRRNSAGSSQAAPPETPPLPDAPIPAHAELPAVAHAESPVVAHTESPIAAHAESPVVAHTESPIAAHTESPVAAHTESPVAAHTELPAAANAEPPVAVLAEAPTGAETPPGLDANIARADSPALVGQSQQVAALQQVALLQQAALAQQMALTQQVVMLQYLQLVSQGSNPRVGAAAHVPRRPTGGRIVDTLPSTFSATDNPWGFTYPPMTLVR